MERAASVPYSEAPPAPSGEIAQNGSGAQEMRVQATPNSFGAPIGAGLSAIGRGVEEDVNKIGGMITETAANQAEIDSVKATAPIIAKYKSLQGLSAYAAAPQFEKEILDTNQKIRDSLPGGAQRMFDANTARRSAYMIEDYQTYAAGQVKKATLDSNNAIAQNAISSAGDPSIAADDARFGGVIGDIKHSVASMMDVQGWGTAATTDQKTGKVTFANNPQGQQAQSVYQSEVDKRTGLAWETRLHSLADQNVGTAYKTFQDNRTDIPGEAQVRLDAYFTPKVRDYQSRSLADTVLAQHDQEYKNSLTPSNAQGDIADAIHQQESGGKPHDFQIQQGTFDQYAKPGESFSNPEDQDKVYGRIISDLQKSYPGDPARQAVAYFSGKGNVSEVGPIPWKNDKQDANGKSVSSYVGDILNRVGAPQKVQSTSLVPSQADYYRSNYDSIVEQTRREAAAQHPDDPAFIDSSVAKIEQRMGASIRGQELSYKVDNDTVMRGFDGGFTQGKRPTSVDELRATNPQVSQAWDRLLVNNPIAASAIENRLLTANAKGTYNSSNAAGYSAAENRMFLPRTDPRAITDEAQLWPLVSDGTITGKDRDNLAKMMGDMQDPRSKTELALRKNVVDSALNQIMPAKMRSSGFTDPVTDSKLQQARLAIQTADEDAIKAGKTASQRYDPTSKDFVGNAAKQFLPTPAQKLDAARKQPDTPLQTFNSPDDPAFAQLPSGTRFMTPDGKIRVKN